jgi:signal transduction histidine kinase
MISSTLENVFILSVFQLLVAGVILCTTAASIYFQKDASARKSLKLISAAFVFYSAHFLLEAWVHYRNLSSPATATMVQGWNFLAHALESVAFLCLGLAYLPQSLVRKLNGRSRWMPAVVLGILIGALYSAQQWQMQTYGRSPFTSLFNAAVLAAAALLHLRDRGSKGLFIESPLYLLSLVQVLEATGNRTGASEQFWLAAQAATLLGLGLFALVVDRRTRNLQLRFFLRLNLTFIALASLLILIVAGTERREYLQLAESHAEDLSEFLRGHVIYFHNLGMQPPEILSDPGILRRVTADFGRLADLRRVRVSIGDWYMEMELHEDWTISHQVHSGAAYAIARPEERGRVATLTPIPIVSSGTKLGQIELDQGLRSINNRVAQQMRVIFLTFTITVLVAAVLFGLTVQQANKTIQKQFEELERTHSQLANVERLATVGQLAGGLAHEINNPAGIIITTSDYALRQLEGMHLQDSFREDLEAIRRQARRISNTVSGLLTFSRPALLQKRSTDMNAVIRQCLALLAPRFHKQQIGVEDRLSPELPSVSADPDRLEQVIVNLLNNAVDAMPSGGTITVASGRNSSDTRSVMVSVGDSGRGISEEDQKHIFDPFFSTKPKGQGTGLGLFVSYGIIQDHGGTIEVETQLHRGTVFRIRLPIVEDLRGSL